MPWPAPPPAGTFCGTPYQAALREARALLESSVLRANWPAPPGVHALTTLRGPAGDARAPFDAFDLGLRNGDDVAVVQANRDLVARGHGLPSPPRWLRQVHGTTVAIEPDGEKDNTEPEVPESERLRIDPDSRIPRPVQPDLA